MFIVLLVPSLSSLGISSTTASIALCRQKYKWLWALLVKEFTLVADDIGREWKHTHVRAVPGYYHAATRAKKQCNWLFIETAPSLTHDMLWEEKGFGHRTNKSPSAGAGSSRHSSFSRAPTRKANIKQRARHVAHAPYDQSTHPFSTLHSVRHGDCRRARANIDKVLVLRLARSRGPFWRPNANYYTFGHVHPLLPYLSTRDTDKNVLKPVQRGRFFFKL